LEHRKRKNPTGNEAFESMSSSGFLIPIPLSNFQRFLLKGGELGSGNGFDFSQI